MSKLDKILDSYIKKSIGNRIPTEEDVRRAYRDGMLSVKRDSWHTDGMPNGNKTVLGVFLCADGTLSLRVVDNGDIGNLFAGSMLAWAYLNSIVPMKTMLDGAKRRGLCE